MFLVRKGNPWKIKDWSDLVKPGIQVDHAESEDLGRRALGLSRGVGLCAEGSRAAIRTRRRPSSQKLYSHVPVLDTGARGSTTTFAQRGIGDVLLSWENEAYLALDELGRDKFEIVYPSVSILAEPPVAVVDKNVDRHGTRKVAEAYLNFLYTKEGQEIEAKNYYRPRDPAIAAAHATDFPKISSIRSTKSSAAGPRRRRRTSPTAACSTRSTSPAK